jgi:hypothetical protein
MSKCNSNDQERRRQIANEQRGTRCFFERLTPVGATEKRVYGVSLNHWQDIIRWSFKAGTHPEPSAALSPLNVRSANASQ